MEKDNQVAYLSHDPFSRTDGIRVRVLLPHNSHLTCDWCGQPGKTTKLGDRILYRYGYEDSWYKRSLSNGLFCCIGCYRDYSN